MKCTALILIGYIICTLKCEINKTEAEEKTGNVELLYDKDQQVDIGQPEDAKQPENVEATYAIDTITAAAAEDTTYTVNTTAKAAADTIYAVTQTVQQPKGVETTDALDTTDAVDTPDAVDTNTTFAVEQPDNTEQPEDGETTDAVDTTDAVNTIYAVDTTLRTHVGWYAVPVETEQPIDTEQPIATEQPIDTEQPEEVEQPKDVEKTEATKKQEKQADDTGPSKIKVEDALKILEKSKKKYTLESIALIKKLEWLRSTFNITELMIDHKIDPNEDFDDLSNTENSLNSSNILRQYAKDGFWHVKNAIMKISKFKPVTSIEMKKQLQMTNLENANRYKANFISTHSDRDNLKKIYLADSD